MSVNHGSRIIVFIPVYRCANQIARVIKKFDENTQRRFDTVIIIDNRSTDNTLETAIKVGCATFKFCRLIVWQNDHNYGLGGSHKAAFRFAIENSFDYMVVLHGDDQADIREVLPLLDADLHKKVDCLLGARFMRGSQLIGYSRLRTLGNKMYNKLFSFITFTNIHDLGSGLNIYRLSALKDFYYKSFPDDLTFNYVMLLASYNRKQAVRYFPISWSELDQTSNVKLVRQAARVLGMIIAYFFLRKWFLVKDMRVAKIESYTGQIVYQKAPSQL